MFNAPGNSVAESEETPCHGLLGRGSRVTTRRSVATGENQSGVYSIKLTRMFNQRRKNRHARRILSNLGNPERRREHLLIALFDLVPLALVLRGEGLGVRGTIN